MKIIISESQELNAKQKLVFFLLDKENFNLIQFKYMIYFVKNIGERYATIGFNTYDGRCAILHYLISWLSKLTSFQESELNELISDWVERTLQMEVKHSNPAFPQIDPRLTIPYNRM